MSNFTKSVSLGAHNIAFSLLRKLVGTIPQVWEQSRPFLRWRVNLLWEQTQEGGNFLRACELADTTVPLYYDSSNYYVIENKAFSKKKKEKRKLENVFVLI